MMGITIMPVMAHQYNAHTGRTGMHIKSMPVLESSYSAIGLPDASLTFALHSDSISFTTDCGREM